MPRDIIVNPQTGERMMLVNGSWQPMAPRASRGGAVPGGGGRLSPVETKTLETAKAAAREAVGKQRMLNRFGELNRERGTGQLLGIPGVSEVLSMFDPRLAEMQSITNALAPRERAAGSGAMSDKDVALYRSAVPNPNRPGDSNKQVRERMMADLDETISYANFLDRYAQRRGSLSGADEAFRAYRAGRQKSKASGGGSPGYKIISVED